MIGAMVENVEV